MIDAGKMMEQFQAMDVVVANLKDLIQKLRVENTDLREQLAQYQKSPTENNKWISPNSLMPKDDQRIDWMDSSGSVVYGGWVKGRLWFCPDGVYVYYTPQFWRAA